MTRYDGKPKTMQRCHLHLVSATHSDQIVTRGSDDNLPEPTNVHGRIAGIWHGEHRHIKPGLYHQLPGIKSVAPDRLANRPDPARQDAVTERETGIFLQMAVRLIE